MNQLGRFENGAPNAEFFSAGLNVSISFNKNTAPHTCSGQSAVP
jgi:hypothetical protein